MNNSEEPVKNAFALNEVALLKVFAPAIVCSPVV
jgi:hypothetical protein